MHINSTIEIHGPLQDEKYSFIWGYEGFNGLIIDCLQLFFTHFFTTFKVGIGSIELVEDLQYNLLTKECQEEIKYYEMKS